MTKEMENSIKTHYVKNVIFSFLTTNDQSVHMNLVKVLIQAMKFNEDESQKIIEFQEENNRSVVSKVRVLSNRVLFSIDHWWLLLKINIVDP